MFLPSFSSSSNNKVKKSGDTMTGNLIMGTNQVNHGTGTAFIASNGTRIVINGGNTSIQFDNFPEWFLNTSNPNFSIFSGSDNLFSVINTGGGKGSFSSQNILYFGYGDFLGVSPASNWPSGT